jgi:hypothetical protein
MAQFSPFAIGCAVGLTLSAAIAELDMSSIALLRVCGDMWSQFAHVAMRFKAFSSSEIRRASALRLIESRADSLTVMVFISPPRAMAIVGLALRHTAARIRGSQIRHEIFAHPNNSTK